MDEVSKRNFATLNQLLKGQEAKNSDLIIKVGRLESELAELRQDHEKLKTMVWQMKAITGIGPMGGS